MCLQCSAYKWSVFVMLRGWPLPMEGFMAQVGWLTRVNKGISITIREAPWPVLHSVLPPRTTHLRLLNTAPCWCRHRATQWLPQASAPEGLQEFTAIGWLLKLFLYYLDRYLSIHRVNNCAWVILILLLPVWDGYIRTTAIWSHFSSHLMLQVSVGSCIQGFWQTNGVSGVRLMYLHSLSLYAMIYLLCLVN